MMRHLVLSAACLLALVCGAALPANASGIIKLGQYVKILTPGCLTEADARAVVAEAKKNGTGKDVYLPLEKAGRCGYRIIEGIAARILDTFQDSQLGHLSLLELKVDDTHTVYNFIIADEVIDTSI